jgi:hypothetical protein
MTPVVTAPGHKRSFFILKPLLDEIVKELVMCPQMNISGGEICDNAKFDNPLCKILNTMKLFRVSYFCYHIILLERLC